MPVIYQSSQLNISALTVADIYVGIVQPQFLLNGVPSNIVGFVGTASWGPIGVPTIGMGYADYVTKFGPLNARKYDMGTAVWAAALATGQPVVARYVRVTDGTDTAASATVQSNCLTLTSKYSGSLGNSQLVTIQPGSQAGTQRLVATLPGTGIVPEIFDNITQGVGAVTVTAGTGATAVPTVTFTPPVQNVVNVAVASGGAGHAAGDMLTLPNGVQLRVLTVSGGAVASVAIINAGQLTNPTVPSNPVAMSSSTGAGTGATFNLTWAQQPGTARATGTASLKVVSATVGAGGSGYAVNDTVTLANGVVITVNSVTSGAVSTITVTNGGALTSGAVPSNPAAQVSSSGAGTGATFNLTWGLGPVTITNRGTFYAAAPTVTFGAGAGSGSATATISYWGNMADAVNNGQSGYRGPSAMLVATAGAGTATPVAATYSLAGGTDGANPATIAANNAAAMIGVDSIPRKGMYAMRGNDISMALLVDVDDATTWTTQVSFGLAEGIYMIATGPQGDTISNAVAVKSNNGIDSYTLKLMLGDWVYVNDTVTNQTRLVSPQCFVAGILGNLAPNQSSLNKQLYGIVGTQKSQTQMPYTAADLDVLARAGIDVICNPAPGGKYFACRNGYNTSSNRAVRGDNYTRMTNYIAKTLANGMGYYVGQLQTPDERRRAKTTLDAFLALLQFTGLIGTADGSPCFKVVLDASNNPQSTVALGYQFANVQVIYLSVIEFFVISLEGGQTVTITPSGSPQLVA